MVESDMPGRFVLAAAAAIAVLVGCASKPPQQDRKVGRVGESSGYNASYRPGSTLLPGAGEKDDDGLVVRNEKGALDQSEVDRILDRHSGALGACYDRAGAAQKYAAGDVLLHFFVSSTGAVSDVIVSQSALGNYAVERCLVFRGRKIVFPAPGGKKATDFEYSLLFRSSGELPVVDRDEDEYAQDFAQLAPQLAACGPLGSRRARAVVYVEPGGTVGSVGLEAEEPLDDDAALCVVEQIQGWPLPNSGSHVVRTSFAVAPLPTAPPVSKPGRRVKRGGRRS
jgi:hypothetical protein